MSGGPPPFRIGPDEDPDRYRLDVLHSSGAEGQVWRGSRELQGTELQVAIKILHPARANLINEWRTRWREQVELLRSLQYPGVVPVREAFAGPFMHPPGELTEQGRSLYLVMNWIEGESLQEWVGRRSERDFYEVFRILTQVADALDYMHSGRPTGGKPVLHRDVKPANIIVTERGAVLVDFGLVDVLTSKRTPAGVGTPRYIAPETIDSGAYTPASDRYSLGCVVYFALTGEDPPAGFDVQAMRTRLATVPLLASNPGLVDHLLSMVDPDPDKRPTNAVAWAQLFRSSSVSNVAGARETVTNPRPAVPPPDPTAVLPMTAEPRPTPVRRYVAIAAAAATAAALLIAVLVRAGGGDGSPVAAGTTIPVVSSTSTSSSSSTTSSSLPPSTTTSIRGSTSSSSRPDSIQSKGILTQFLDSVPTVGGTARPGQTGVVTVNGVTYTHSLQHTGDDCYSNKTATWEYDLGRHYKTFAVTVGLRDDSATGSEWRFEVFLDTQRSNEENVALGQTKSLTVDVADVLRMRLMVTVVSSLGSCADSTATWADARISGNASDIPTTTTRF